MDKSISTQCGHVKRRLSRHEPLTGKVLEFALSTIDEAAQGGSKDFLNGIAQKLTAGERLSEYESHFMVDVILLHKRLGG